MMVDQPGQHSLTRIVMVLDHPMNVANIGAVVRMMGNFGLSTLRLVGSTRVGEAELLRFARRGAAIVSAIQHFDHLHAALGDCAFVVGATRRSRALERPVLSPREAAAVLLNIALLAQHSGGPADAETGRVAVLFGPEDFGLSNAALEYCNAIVTIPTVAGDASLNLAQAAVVIAYELFMATLDCGAPGGQRQGPLFSVSADRAAPLATAAALDALFGATTRMYSALHPNSIGGQSKAAVSRFRAMILRSVPSVDEVEQLISVFERVAHTVHPAPDPDCAP